MDVVVFFAVGKGMTSPRELGNQVYEDVPVIIKDYTTKVNDDTLTEALDQVEESSSSDDDTSDEEESSEWDRQRILLVVFIVD